MEPLGALARGPLGLTGERLALAAAVVAAVALFFALAKLRRLDRRVRALERDSPAADDDSTQALRVALTGLPTRHLLFEMLDKQLAQARRYGSFLGIVVLDLDGLKAINEAYGLAVGDRVLQTTARRLTTSLREADFLAHLHGDAFGVVLTELERVENLLAAVQRLLAEVRRPIPTKGVELLVTASVGVASFPEDGADAARLMSRAEEALKRAKSRGGNNLQLYQESMNRWVKLRMDLQQDLRKALSGDQLEVHYQPQISLADGAVVGCEALVRWRHPRQGLLSAGKFIPLAEEIGIMPELGRWIVWEVCRQLAAWGRSGLTDIPISVNVSVRQFQHDDVGDMVRRALTEHRVVPERLWIELTESIAMEDGVDTATVLPELRGLGIKICLDDFGTGYSSLSFLAHHPVDVIKIDASFVAEAPASPLHASIVTMTVSLAESLGLEVVAEGVERPEHLAFLRAHGCGAAQGYLLGRPAPVGELEKLLAGQLDLRRLAAAG